MIKQELSCCWNLFDKIEISEGDESGMDDLISRQAAIDAVRASTKKYTGFMEMEMYTDDDAVEAIINLPPAQPEKVCIAKITLSEEQVREAKKRQKCLWRI